MSDSDEQGYFESLSPAQRRQQARSVVRKLLGKLDGFKPWQETALEIRKALPVLQRLSELEKDE